MKLLILLLLFALAFVFSSCEDRLWGSARTPFAFVVYPFLAVLVLVDFVGRAMGFLPIRAETLVVVGFFFALMAVSSLSVRSLLGERVMSRAPLETIGEKAETESGESPISSLEYLIVLAVLLVFFGSNLLGKDFGTLGKGELGIGGIKGHVMEIGIAYLVIAASQRKGQLIVRAALILFMLWILAFNQVKYLIMLPLAAVLVYRWVSGQLATWKLGVLVLTVPLIVVTIVYAIFGVAAGLGSAQISPALLSEMAKHMVAYIFAGVVGLDQLLLRGQLALLGSGGLDYAFAPFINTAQFVAGKANYIDVINPLYLIIHTDGFLDSNVFTVFGSVLYRGGWIVAVAISLAYAIISYLIWSDWRTRTGPLECAPGSWWLAPLVFAWFDPFFTLLSLMEVMMFLWLRAKLR